MALHKSNNNTFTEPLVIFVDMLRVIHNAKYVGVSAIYLFDDCRVYNVPFQTANGHPGALHERPYPAIFHPPQITRATPAPLLNHLPIGRT